MESEFTHYHAHSANAHGRWHLLKEHLTAVGRLAAIHAGSAAWADEAALAGLLHDLGKYADRFQARLAGKESGLDHWSQGAWIVLAQFRAIAAALSIQGHHVGLQRGDKPALRNMNLSDPATRHPFNLRLSDSDHNRLMQRAHVDGLQFNTPPSTALALQGSFAQSVAAMLDVRLLFSCLVDADFLDTEAHFDGDTHGKCARPAGPALDAQVGLDALHRYMSERIRVGTQADAQVLAAREALWRAAGEAGVRCRAGVRCQVYYPALPSLNTTSVPLNFRRFKSGKWRACYAAGKGGAIICPR